MKDVSEQLDFYIDKAGNKVVVGDTIVYGHNLGRCAGLRYGKVLKIRLTKNTFYGNKEYRITVHGVDDDWGSSEPELCRKKGTLMFPQRTLKIPPELIPEKAKKLLEKVDFS